MTRYVSIFADASYCHATGAAGWGCWVGYGDYGNALTDGGPLTGAANSAHAELMALEHAVRAVVTTHAERVHPHEPDVLLYLQSDNLQVLSAVRRVLNCPDRPYRENHRGAHVPLAVIWPDAWTPLLTTLATYLRGLRIFTRHVKGHTSRPEGRYRVNVKCDRIAKHHMHAQRAALARASNQK